MLGSARAVPEGSTLRCDVCIVGAGAAGITRARALAGTRQKVILLESFLSFLGLGVQPPFSDWEFR